MAAHSSEHPIATELKEESTALYPNAFAIPLREGEQPRANVAVAHQLPTLLEPSVHFHRFREPLDTDSASHGIKLHVPWRLSPDALEKAHQLVYFHFGSRRVTEDGHLEIVPPEERTAPPSCFLATNLSVVQSGFDTSAATVDLFWDHDIKIGAGQVHCVTASGAQETADTAVSPQLLNSIATCTNDQDSGDATSPVWQACPYSSDEWLLDDDDDPLMNDNFPENHAGDWLQFVLERLEDVLCVTKSPNVAFEVALCYYLLCENSKAYDHHTSTYTAVAECDGLVADLLRCEPEAVRVAQKRLSITGFDRCFRLNIFEYLKRYDELHPKCLTKSVRKI